LASLIGTFIARELLAAPAALEILVLMQVRIKPLERDAIGWDRHREEP